MLEGKQPAAVAQIAGNANLTNEQRSRIPYVMALYHNCFLCEADPPPAGVYTYKRQQPLPVNDVAQAAEGTVNTILVPICKNCVRLLNHKDIILEKLREGDM